MSACRDRPESKASSPKNSPLPRPNAALGQDHLDRARNNKVDSIAAFAFSNDPFLRYRESGAQQSAHALELTLVEAGQQIEPLHQLMRIEAYIEARALGGARSLRVALEIVVDLKQDQPLLEQALIADHFMMKRRLAKKPYLKLCQIVGILPAQRVKSARDRLLPPTDDDADLDGNVLAEKGCNLLIDEVHKTLDGKARH
jgi:hypothetical protein